MTLYQHYALRSAHRSKLLLQQPTYLLAVQTSIIGSQRDVFVSCNIEALTLNRFWLGGIGKGRNDGLQFLRGDLKP